ncbi:MAG: 23S rRNA (adenine(1618)-N(6))-methyltransferase RlmF [Bacteroidetes bacterium]|nr:23S rRNA (adenine(1618)-N(6))-methyltransferase RlmF [Bacteroidota bacterium]
MDALAVVHPPLKPFLFELKYTGRTIDFFDQDAVKALNKALLIKHYGIKKWNIPDDYLSPPVPGRADYIHHVADLLALSNNGKIPKGPGVKMLDIGTGANAIYPILAVAEYSWLVIGSDFDPTALKNAAWIVDSNKKLIDKVELRLQERSEAVFEGVLRQEEYIDLSICNPPFYASANEAQAANERKNKNLGNSPFAKKPRNFGGKANELWTPGGEVAFVKTMIRESRNFRNQVLWFSSLVSSRDNLPELLRSLEQSGAETLKVIDMEQGNKTSRIICWTFLNPSQHKAWAEYRWS